MNYDTATQRISDMDCVFGLSCLPSRRGLSVLNVVRGSVSHLMGIRKGWRILSVNNKDSSIKNLKDAIRGITNGESTDIPLRLKGNKGKIKRVLLPISEPFRSRYSREKQEKMWEVSGAMLGFCVDNDYSALYVMRVKRGSRAEKSGLCNFDRILMVNNMVPPTPYHFFYEVFGSSMIAMRLLNSCGDIRVIRVEKSMFLPDNEQLSIEEAAAKGESIVSNILAQLDNYHELRGVILPISRNRGTEIDHILVGPSGVFVIETKRLSGNIVGSNNKKYWIQNVSGVKKQIFNPVWQNNYHVNAVKRLLNVYGMSAPVISVVVVVGGNIRVNSTTPIISDKELRGFVKKYPESLSSRECKQIVAAIECEKQKSFYSW